MLFMIIVMKMGQELWWWCGDTKQQPKGGMKNIYATVPRRKNELETVFY
jgi:hypothetical protein